MQEFGRFIDDVRKEIKSLNVSFSPVPVEKIGLHSSGETMTLSESESKTEFIVDTSFTGEIVYDTPEYQELLNFAISALKTVSE